MSENPDSAAQRPESGPPEPTVEREGGQYSGGDYGEGGTVGEQPGPETGGYAEGDYGEGGTVGEQSGPGAGGYSGGDYGEGGTVGEQPGPGAGGYSGGDYGEGGTARPDHGGDDALDAENVVPRPAADDTEGAGRDA